MIGTCNLCDVIIVGFYYLEPTTISAGKNTSKNVQEVIIADTTASADLGRLTILYLSTKLGVFNTRDQHDPKGISDWKLKKST